MGGTYSTRGDQDMRTTKGNSEGMTPVGEEGQERNASNRS